MRRRGGGVEDDDEALATFTVELDVRSLVYAHLEIAIEELCYTSDNNGGRVLCLDSLAASGDMFPARLGEPVNVRRRSHQSHVLAVRLRAYNLGYLGAIADTALWCHGARGRNRNSTLPQRSRRSCFLGTVSAMASHVSYRMRVTAKSFLGFRYPTVVHQGNVTMLDLLDLVSGMPRSGDHPDPNPWHGGVLLAQLPYSDWVQYAPLNLIFSMRTVPERTPMSRLCTPLTSHDVTIRLNGSSTMAVYGLSQQVDHNRPVECFVAGVARRQGGSSNGTDDDEAPVSWYIRAHEEGAAPSSRCMLSTLFPRWTSPAPAHREHDSLLIASSSCANEECATSTRYTARCCLFDDALNEARGVGSQHNNSKSRVAKIVWEPSALGGNAETWDGCSSLKVVGAGEKLCCPVPLLHGEDDFRLACAHELEAVHQRIREMEESQDRRSRINFFARIPRT